MIIGRKILARHAIRLHRSDTMGQITALGLHPVGGGRVALRQVLTPIERGTAGPAQEVDPHGLTERLVRSRPRKAKDIRFIPVERMRGRAVVEIL